MPDDKTYAKIDSDMTSLLRLAGMDLLVFSYIYSLTKDGESEKPFFMSAEAFSQKWFGDVSKARAIKDSLKGLTEVGLLSKGTIKVNKRERTTYTSCMAACLKRINDGVSLPEMPKKRRNKRPSDGTVPLTESGTVPSSEVVPYHHKSGTVPSGDSGTEHIPGSGTVPRNNNKVKKIMDNYSLEKVALGTKEEEEAYFIIFFFRNCLDPQKEVSTFLEYNEKNDWSKGKINTFEKRILVAENEWQFLDGRGNRQMKRCDDAFLDAIRRIYVRAHNEKDPECGILLDKELRGRFVYPACGEPSYAVICTSERQREWFQSHPLYCEEFHTIIGRHKIVFAIDTDKPRL
jgi:hypothetical protein